MTDRRRLVVLTALLVVLPLALATTAGVFWRRSARAEQTNDRLDGTLVAAARLVAARQDALAGDVHLAALTAPAPAPADGQAANQAVVNGFVRSGLVDEATVDGPDGTTMARAGQVDPARPLVLAASSPLGPGFLLVGRLGINVAEVAQLSTTPGVRVSVAVTSPRPPPATYARSAPLADGRWLVASTPSGPFNAAQRRWTLGAILAAFALAVVVLAVTRRVLRRVSRPLEGLVRWTDSFIPSDGAPEAGEADVASEESIARAFRHVADDLRARTEELDDTRAAFRLALERLGDMLGSTHDLEGILEVMVETSLLIVPADAAVYYRLVRPPANLRASHAWGVGLEQLMLEGTGLAGYAALTGEVAIWPGPALPDPKEPPAVAAVAVPLHVLGRLVGVLGVYGTTVGHSFARDDIGALQAVLHQAEVAMANVELHTKAQREALTDGLTGLWNRRHFDLRCRDAQLGSSRFGEPFAVVIADIDDFKQVNDRHGHFAGDAALVHLAAILRSASREVDVVARWGGEEFAILVQRGGLAEAVVVAERVCALLREDPVVYEGTVIPFTVSCGVASHPESGATPAEVVAAADAALLRAKGAGKDRVERATASGPPEVPPAGVAVVKETPP